MATCVTTHSHLSKRGSTNHLSYTRVWFGRCVVLKRYRFQKMSTHVIPMQGSPDLSDRIIELLKADLSETEDVWRGIVPISVESFNKLVEDSRRPGCPPATYLQVSLNPFGSDLVDWARIDLAEIRKRWDASIKAAQHLGAVVSILTKEMFAQCLPRVFPQEQVEEALNAKLVTLVVCRLVRLSHSPPEVYYRNGENHPGLVCGSSVPTQEDTMPEEAGGSGGDGDTLSDLAVSPVGSPAAQDSDDDEMHDAVRATEHDTGAGTKFLFDRDSDSSESLNIEYFSSEDDVLCARATSESTAPSGNPNPASTQVVEFVPRHSHLARFRIRGWSDGAPSRGSRLHLFQVCLGNCLRKVLARTAFDLLTGPYVKNMSATLDEKSLVGMSWMEARDTVSPFGFHFLIVWFCPRLQNRSFARSMLQQADVVFSAFDQWKQGLSVIAAIQHHDKELKTLGWLSKELQNSKTLTLAQILVESKSDPFFAPLFVAGSCMNVHTLKTMLNCIAVAVEEPDDEENPRVTDLSDLHEEMNAFQVFELLLVDSLVEVQKGVDLFNYVAVTFILLRERCARRLRHL